MRKLVIGMAMASTALASPALARDGQWYVEGQGGPMLVEDINFDVNSGAGTNGVDTDAGYDFGGVVGYDFGFIRLEAEASWREADLTAMSADAIGVVAANGWPTPVAVATGAGTYPAAGDVNSLSFMVNALADFGDDDGLQGFVGAGAGVARTNVHAYIDASIPYSVDDSDTGFAWQALAGIRAPLTDKIDVGLRYRFFNAEDVSLVDYLGRTLDSRVRTHSLMGTLTYNFGGAPEVQMQTCWNGAVIPVTETCAAKPVVAPPPPPPPPTPKPAPVCNKGPYIVFFDWDKSDITPEAASILDNAVAQYANCGMASVMLAGHADTSGAKAYNVGLSQRRNNAVRSYLAGRGIPDARISSEAFGETDLRVPTADGVREVQNRNVQIQYGPGSGM